MYYFIYETTNKINGKRYRGMHSTPNMEDGYLGSGVYFARSLKKHGNEAFERMVLQYLESTELFTHAENMQRLSVLESKFITEEHLNSQNYYNLQTGGGSNGILCEESKKKISETLKRKYQSGEIEKPKGMTGKIPHNKGKKGLIKHTETRNKLVSSGLKEYYSKNTHHQKGKPAHNKGAVYGPMEESEKMKRSEALKKRYSNPEIVHHRKGTAPWNSGKTGLQEAWNKGIGMPVYVCDCCGKEVAGITNLNRWHNKNCKHAADRAPEILSRIAK